jgi:hypothetical protein
MKFNQLIKTHILPILQKYGFEISEEFKNIIRFQSSVVEINIVYNNREKSCYISMGRKGASFLCPLNDKAVKNLFGSELSIEKTASAVFVRNLSLLFEQPKGIDLLKGNVEPLENFIRQQSAYYTAELIRKQALETASKAWETNDYITFVESMDKIDISKIPRSYQLKYTIAKRKSRTQ